MKNVSKKQIEFFGCQKNLILIVHNWQKNKIINLQLASKKIDGIIIKPGEEFSFWNCVGSCTKEKGYLEREMLLNLLKNF